jgi:hypothetical protein
MYFRGYFRKAGVFLREGEGTELCTLQLHLLYLELPAPCMREEVSLGKKEPWGLAILQISIL